MNAKQCIMALATVAWLFVFSVPAGAAILIRSDTTWSSNTSINEPVFIQNYATLTIAAGVTVTCGTDASFNVQSNCTLNIGSSGGSHTYVGSDGWLGIYVQGGSINIDNATIQYSDNSTVLTLTIGAYGHVGNGSWIRDGSGDNNTYGVYVYGYSGFHLNDSIVRDNGGVGVVGDSYSTVDDEAGGSAWITNNDDDQLWCINSSDYYGYASNNITNGPGYRAYTDGNSYVDATYHWWGTANPPASYFSGNVDYSNPLSSAAKAAVDPLAVQFREAMYHWITGNGEEAVPTFLDIVQNHDDTPYTLRSLVRLAHYYRKASPQTFIELAAELVRKDSKWTDQALDLMTVMLVEAGAYSQARTLADKILTESGNSNEFVLSVIFDMECTKRGNIETARQQLTKWADLFPESKIQIIMASKLQLNVNEGIVYERDFSDTHVAGIDDILSGNVAVDQEASLDKNVPLTNYPNPFNPSTTIQYAVSEEGSVSLKVFDLLGREVTTLVDERQAKGTYRVQWEAGQYVSGMYILKLTAPGQVLTRKLFLVK